MTPKHKTLRVSLAVLVFTAVEMTSSVSFAQANCISITTYYHGGSYDSAMTSALAAIASTGGCISFPSGTFTFNSAVTYTFPSAPTRQQISIVGNGIDATTLYWPSAGGGISITYNTPFDSLSMHDLTISTGVANSTTSALTLYQNKALGNFAPTLLYNLSIRGNDGGGLTDYWAAGVYVVGVCGINFENIVIFGSSSFQGDGIVLSGPAEQAYDGIVYNISNSNFFDLGIGLLYGSWVQGVTVSQSNFTNGTYGIESAANEPGAIDQLTVVASQFAVSGAAIYMNTAINQMMLSSNLFVVPAYATGVELNSNYLFSITGNQFIGPGATYGAEGIVVAGTQANSTSAITGNTFAQLDTGVYLASSSYGVNLQSNSYFNNTNPYINAGSHNTIGGGSP